jgi:hypothetical protein
VRRSCCVDSGRQHSHGWGSNGHAFLGERQFDAAAGQLHVHSAGATVNLKVPLLTCPESIYLVGEQGPCRGTWTTGSNVWKPFRCFGVTLHTLGKPFRCFGIILHAVWKILVFCSDFVFSSQ